MEKEKVQSTGIHWVRYDEDTAVLEVEFTSSLAYKYFDVPREVYEWLLKVDSKGKFVNRLIKDKYRYEQTETAESSNDENVLRELLEKPIDPPSGA